LEQPNLTSSDECRVSDVGKDTKEKDNRENGAKVMDEQWPSHGWSIGELKNVQSGY